MSHRQDVGRVWVGDGVGGKEEKGHLLTLRKVWKLLPAFNQHVLPLGILCSTFFSSLLERSGFSLALCKNCLDAVGPQVQFVS